MEDTTLIGLWKNYSTSLDETLSLNRKNTIAITQLKIRHQLASMKPVKILALLLGIAWVVWVDSLIITTFKTANPFFLVSAIIQVLLTKIAIGIYLYQLVLIEQVNINEPIVATQHKLAKLKSSTLSVARLLFLQLPVWTTFYWNESMFKNGNLLLFAFQAIITLAFTIVSVWIFVNIRQEQKDKKWFRLIFSGREWMPVIKSLELLDELKEYHNEEA